MGKHTDTQKNFHEQMKELDPDYKKSSGSGNGGGPLRFIPFILILGLIFYVYYYNQTDMGSGGNLGEIVAIDNLGAQVSSNHLGEDYYKNLDPEKHDGNADKATNKYVRGAANLMNITNLEDNYSAQDVQDVVTKLIELKIPKDLEPIRESSIAFYKEKWEYQVNTKQAQLLRRSMKL